MQHEFPLENFAQENKIALSNGPIRCSRKCFTETTYIFCMLFIAGRGREDVNPR